MDKLPFFERGQCYYDVLKKTLMHLIEGPEFVPATYLFATVAAGAESGWTRMDTNATDLETDKEELFYQWFFGILKAGKVYIQYPVGEELWTTDKLVPTTGSGGEQASINNQISPYNDPNKLTEFFIVKGITVAFDYYNDQPFTLRQKLRFVGRKYKQEEIKPTDLMFNELVKTARPLYMRRIV